mmetsp:Transcript_24261/g.31580  ORF Transcript_24261/g.31580 Transcript_24261/m.31580 type:complete len:928 (-) Transcript_24261:1951-4734(-)|eukprot:CAMPEP_0197300662 /NCGR_PEP_ID=MMETSP0890-20130614/48895_1 /TAXON_ID=44058 ORGANISM="Aureoumbra lagunensis, Strain CCMP1510" /NCGR_SAMPLE_ID=MMETSP0890 /ASSEMBLY_ACC=CAM_ASM_000533 /LENGTH=927 /DNA_ID=CAMNT_0042779627 /DNA_START=99 /DNA_END=2882 /DNA_ORIENTATION=+
MNVLILLFILIKTANSLSIQHRKYPNLFSTKPLPNKPKLQRPPEVMAPVGGWPQLRAAIYNGADSVYLGLSTFSARARASNFEPGEELKEAVAFAHEREVYLYVAINTLAFDEEFEHVEKLLDACKAAQCDAVIVQDLGVQALAVSKGLIVHASTQQSISSNDAVNFAISRGAKRIVLGRELSIQEISAITASSEAEIEVFVHGALCISWSGQCLSSESWGGRSANRGQCAQACRLPYELIVDGQNRLDDMGYLLSPQDLCALDQIPQLIQAGVSCLKIEGRLKDERYVAATTRAYREAIDRYFSSLSFSSVSRYELAQIFSRGQDAEMDGLTPGFLNGVDHQRLVRGRVPRHRGLFCGILSKDAWLEKISEKVYKLCFEISQISKDDIRAIKVGDGLVLDSGSIAAYNTEEFGGRVVEAAYPKVAIELRNVDPSSSFSNLPSANTTLVWRTADPQIDAKFKRLAQPSTVDIVKRTAVDVFVSASSLELRVKDTNVQVLFPKVSNDEILSSRKVIQALGTLGDTPWSLGHVRIDEPRCSLSALKSARRQAVAQLRKIRQEQLFSLSQNQILEQKTNSVHKKETQVKEGIAVLVRSMEQCRAVVTFALASQEKVRKFKIDEIVLDFLEVKGFREAIEYVRKTAPSQLRVVIATPRLLIPGEEKVRTTLLELEPDAILVRSVGQLYAFRQEANDIELYGDFSLNAANTRTVQELINAGLDRVTPAFDLSGPAVTRMATSTSHCLEAVVHCHLPIFHSSHCVFARHLSNGNNYTNCGHPCERHQIHLRHDGADHLVLADMGCRNTVFNAAAQSAAHYLSAWLDADIRRFRIEFVDENANAVNAILAAYVDLFHARGNAPEPLWSLLASVPNANGRKGGVHAGSYRDMEERPSGILVATKATGDKEKLPSSNRLPSSSQYQRRKRRRRAVI